MRTVTAVDSSSSPGLTPERFFENLEERTAAGILPTGSLSLVATLRPELLSGNRRAETLGRLLSVELAVNDLNRRSMLLRSMPPAKASELESRVGSSIDSLCSQEELSYIQRRTILGFFGVATLPERSSDGSGEIVTIEGVRSLFPHQKRAASAVEYHLYRGSGRVMLHLPTGSGKTRTAMSIVASHLRGRSKTLVIWLASTSELLEQAAIEFEEVWRTTGDRATNCCRFWSHYDPPLAALNDGIVVAGLSKLHSHGRVRENLWRLGDQTSLVVFDEAHQAVATTYRDLVETIATRNPRTGLLGLSATPGRTWNEVDLDATVAEVFHNNKVTLDFGGENPVTWLTREGYLSSVEFSLLNVEPGLELSASDLADLAESLEVPAQVCEGLGNDQQRNLRIVQRLLELADDHNRILVYAASVDNAVLLASVCRAAGLAADAVTAATDRVERKRIIERFKRSSRSPRVLMNYGVLTTGFDAPSASAALIARPTRSLVLYSQMVGRVIRGPKAGGTETCEVVTVVDTNLPGFATVAEAFVNWEDVWTV